ncbi:MAG: GNAT family N-acetyltransferase [Rickettsiales bacterium]
MTRPFRIEPLQPTHQRSSFQCAVEPLDHYLRHQASQDQRRRVATCFVAIEQATGGLAGYYTLAASSVPLSHLPEALAKRLPRYPLVPVVLLGRLAVDTRFRGQRLGGSLLWDAAARAVRAEVGTYALVVDAKDEQAAAFYHHHGFTPLDSPQRLVLPLASFAALAGNQP